MKSDTCDIADHRLRMKEVSSWQLSGREGSVSLSSSLVRVDTTIVFSFVCD